MAIIEVAHTTNAQFAPFTKLESDNLVVELQQDDKWFDIYIDNAQFGRMFLDVNDQIITFVGVSKDNIENTELSFYKHDGKLKYIRPNEISTKLINVGEILLNNEKFTTGSFYKIDDDIYQYVGMVNGFYVFNDKNKNKVKQIHVQLVDKENIVKFETPTLHSMVNKETLYDYLFS